MTRPWKEKDLDFGVQAPIKPLKNGCQQKGGGRERVMGSTLEGRGMRIAKKDNTVFHFLAFVFNMTNNIVDEKSKS